MKVITADEEEEDGEGDEEPRAGPGVLHQVYRTEASLRQVSEQLVVDSLHLQVRLQTETVSEQVEDGLHACGLVVTDIS